MIKEPLSVEAFDISPSRRTKLRVIESNQALVAAEGGAVTSLMTTTSLTAMRNLFIKRRMLCSIKLITTKFHSIEYKKIELPVLLAGCLLLVVGQAKDPQNGIGPIGTGSQNVRKEHRQATIVIQPPDVDCAPLLLQTEAVDAV